MARLRHFAVCVGDLERSAKFYAEVFGLEQVGREDLDIGSAIYMSDGVIDFALLNFSGRRGNDIKGDPTKAIGANHFGFQVDDLVDTQRRIESAGGTFFFDLGDERHGNFESSSRIRTASCSTSRKTAGSARAAGGDVRPGSLDRSSAEDTRTLFLSQLEGRDPENLAAWQDGWRTVVHARAAEDLTQAVPARERHGLRIVFRHIDKNGLARRDVSEAPEQDVRNFRIRGEQGSDLEPLSAGSNDAVSLQYAVLHSPQRAAPRLVDPGLQELLSWCRKVRSVVARYFGEGNRTQVHQRFLLRRRRSDPGKAQIPVAEDEAPAGIKSLHVEDAVHPDQRRCLQA